MLIPPRLRGAEQLRLFVHELTFDRTCQVLKVHPTTLRRWLRDDPEPPQAALQALYWLTSYGFSDAAAQVHWSHQYLAARVRQLEQLLAFRAGDDWRAANEDAWAAPGLQLTWEWPGRA